MLKQFLAADGAGGGTPPANDDATKEVKDAQEKAGDIAGLSSRIAELERQKSQLEKDLHKERESKKSREAEAKDAAEKSAALRAAAVKLAKDLGVEIPGLDPTSELAAKIKVIEDEKHKAAEDARDSEVKHLRIERELLKALAGKVDDLDYALYQAGRLDAYGEITVEGEKVIGLEPVVEALTKAGVVKAGSDNGGKPAPGVGGQPKLQDAKYPWREAKDWPSFLALPFTQQQEARAKDPDFVAKLETSHFQR